jgi:hypothetical protein
VQLSHRSAATLAVFDDPNPVSSAGLVPVLALPERVGLRELADAHLSVPTDKGSNAGLKVTSLVAGMVAGADSIEDMALLRHGGMGRLFARVYAPSTLGSFLRAFTFGQSASSTRSPRGSWSRGAQCRRGRRGQSQPDGTHPLSLARRTTDPGGPASESRWLRTCQDDCHSSSSAAGPIQDGGVRCRQGGHVRCGGSGRPGPQVIASPSPDLRGRLTVSSHRNRCSPVRIGCGCEAPQALQRLDERSRSSRRDRLDATTQTHRGGW